MSHSRDKVEQLKKKIVDLGPFLPGTLSTQWNTCGTPGCQCHVDKSKRHGPYYQVSFTVQGRSSTLFVKKGDLPEVRKRIKRYKQFRHLCAELTSAWIERTRREGFQKENAHAQ